MDYNTVSMIVGVSLSIGFGWGALTTIIIYDHFEKRKKRLEAKILNAVENWKKENH